ncbi:hypothetical protein [Pedococcus sp. 5OH_020]|uniref:hypothetical protein n=1 Tax=Pedococcus sp. 5OH_020 TaxID=2989814 RepID=UPI0022E9B0F4|nr:hypothetical protein [Pedococcus sp. 5OH_020]
MAPPVTTSSSQTSSTNTREPASNALGLSPAQVVGSALAAATSALAASFLGVAGTIIGAVFGSLVATIASAVYAHSLRHASTRIREVRPIVMTRDAVGRVHVVHGPGTTAVADNGDDANANAAAHRPRRTPSVPRWAAGGVAVVAAAGLALGAITGAEALLGHPVSNSSAKGTTLSTAFDGSGPTSQKTPKDPSTPQRIGTPGASETSTRAASATQIATAPPISESQPTGTPSESGPSTNAPTDHGPTTEPTAPSAPEASTPSQQTP